MRALPLCTPQSAVNAHATRNRARSRWACVARGGQRRTKAAGVRFAEGLGKRKGRGSGGAHRRGTNTTPVAFINARCHGGVCWYSIGCAATSQAGSSVSLSPSFFDLRPFSFALPPSIPRNYRACPTFPRVGFSHYSRLLHSPTLRSVTPRGAPSGPCLDRG